jgi:uncharacterized membrane protein
MFITKIQVVVSVADIDGIVDYLYLTLKILLFQERNQKRKYQIYHYVGCILTFHSLFHTKIFLPDLFRMQKIIRTLIEMVRFKTTVWGQHIQCIYQLKVFIIDRSHNNMRYINRLIACI